MTEYTAEQYKEMTGFEPRLDDLERTNCPRAGELGHFHCGVCSVHKQPRHHCGCWKDERGEHIVQLKES